MPTSRRHDLDALRAFAMLLGIALHAGLSFVEFPWVVQDRSQNPAFGLFFCAVHGFRMPLFFLISGFFTAMLWRNRGLSALIGHRARRILLPLFLGTLTIVPAMWAVIILAGASGPPAATAKTDIWSCAKEGNLDGLRRHIASGVDLDEAGPVLGQTPLAWAAITGRPEVVELLLDAGADPNARHKDRNTALHTAAFLGRARCAELLLEAGADPEARNTTGDAPIDSLGYDRATTRFVTGLLKVPFDYEEIAAGRERIAGMLRDRGASPLRSKGEGLSAVVMALVLFPFFHHLWFLWFLCYLVAGFALVVLVGPRLRLPAPPGYLVCSPLRWLWILPLTLAPQLLMHEGGRIPGYGTDLSAGLLPMPHVLLYYAIFFGFGALYHDSRDDKGRLGHLWWANLALGLLVVFPVSLAFSFHLDWTRDLVDGMGHRVIAAVLEVLFTWLMVFGLMGLCRRALAKERYGVRYLSDASYWLYLAHLPVIIVAQILVQAWPLPALVKFGLVLLGVTALLMGIYRYAVRYTWLGRMLNGPRTRPAPAKGTPP